MKPNDFINSFFLLLLCLISPFAAYSNSKVKLSEKDSLLKRYESLYFTNQARKMIKSGNSELAVSLLNFSLPQDTDNPDRPFVKEPLLLLYDIYFNEDNFAEVLSERFLGNISAFSADNKYIISSFGKNIELWSVDKGTVIARMENPDIVNAIEMSPFDNTLFIAGTKGEIMSVNLAKNKSSLLPFVHPGKLNMIKVSPDGKNMITVGEGYAQIWDIQSGAPADSLIRDVVYANYSSSGEKLTFISTQNKIGSIDLKSGVKTFYKNIPASKIAVTSRCGNYIATVPSNRGRNIDIYNVNTGLLVASRNVNEYITNISFSIDGKVIYVHTVSKLRRVGGIPGISGMRHDFNILGIDISPCSRYVATCSGDFTARVWNASDGAPVTPPLEHKHKVVRMVDFSPCGNYLLSLPDNSSKVYVWDIKTGKEIPLGISIKKGKFFSAKFSPCGKYILTSSNDMSATLWSTETGRTVYPLMYHPTGVNWADFSNDGKYVITTAADGKARLWNIKDNPGAYRAKIEGVISHDSHLVKAVFSPDNNKVATLGKDSTVKIMSVSTGKQCGKELRHNNTIFDVAFSSKSDKIATMSKDSTAVIWDAATGKRLLPPLKHGGYAHQAVFLENDKYLAVSSWDGNIYIWDTSNGELAMPVLKHSRRVQDLALSPDRKYLLSSSLDQTAKVWPLVTPDSLIRMFSNYGVNFRENEEFMRRTNYAATAENVEISKSQWLASEAEIALEKKDTLKAVSLLLEGLPENFINPDKGYANEAKELLAYIYNNTGGKKQEIPADSVSVAKYTPCGKFILLGTTNGKIILMESDSLEEEYTIETSGEVNDIAITKDLKYIAAITNLSEINIWNFADGSPVSKGMKHIGANKIVMDNSNMRVASFHYVYGPSMKNTEKEDKTVKVWDLSKGKQVTQTVPFINNFSSVSFSSDNCSLLVTSPGSPAKLFSAENGKKQIVSIAPSTYYPYAETSPCNKYILTIYENQVRVPSAADGYLVYDPVEFPDRVFKAVFSPCGKFFAAFNLGSQTGSSQVRFYETETGKELFRPLTFPFRVFDLIFAANGEDILINGSITQLWNISKGEPSSAAENHSGIIYTVQLRNNSNDILLMSGGKAYLDKFVSFQQVLEYFRKNNK